MSQECCGCVNLRKGVIATGIIGLIASIFTLIIQFTAIADRNKIWSKVYPTGDNLLSFIFAFGVVVSFVTLISHILLISGAVYQITREVSVWLIINFISILYTFLTMIFVYISFLEHKLVIEFATVLWLEGIVFLINSFFIYLWYHVYIFSRKLHLDGRTSLEGIVKNMVYSSDV